MAIDWFDVRREEAVRKSGKGPRAGIVVAVLLLALRASAQTGSSELVAPQQAAGIDATTLAALGQIDRKGVAPFTLNAKAESGFGQGSFVADPYARNPYVAWGVSIVPAYYPLPQLTLSVFAKLAQEVTNSDIDNQRQQPLFYDMQLRGRYGLGAIPVLGIEAIAEARLYLPTSLVSRYETLVLGSTARISLVRSFGPAVLGWSGNFRKNFHRYQSPVVTEGGSLSGYVRARGAEDLRGSNVAIAGNNVSFSFSNVFFVSYVPVSWFSVSLYYGMAQAYTYRHYERDELSSPNASTGRGQRDTGYGGLELWFRVDQRFSISAGVYTSATHRTDDNKSFRFPFYDFTATASNQTLFYIDVTMTEFLGG